MFMNGRSGFLILESLLVLTLGLILLASFGGIVIMAAKRSAALVSRAENFDRTTESALTVFRDLSTSRDPDGGAPLLGCWDDLVVFRRDGVFPGDGLQNGDRQAYGLSAGGALRSRYFHEDLFPEDGIPDAISIRTRNGGAPYSLYKFHTNQSSPTTTKFPVTTNLEEMELTFLTTQGEELRTEPDSEGVGQLPETSLSLVRRVHLRWKLSEIMQGNPETSRRRLTLRLVCSVGGSQ